jgi:predicted adenine nucleotide alpha hydrolase (AANH) superfamily ATPase
MRLKKVMEYARTHGFTCVASVLAASRHKDLAQVTRAAQRASADTGVPYLHIETRKNGQQTLRHNLIKELSLYQQSYCGCRPPA